MKYLILFLFFSTAFAEHRVDISHPDGRAWSATFKTLGEANAWRAKQLAKSGRKGVTVNVTDITAEVETMRAKREAMKALETKLSQYNCEAMLDGWIKDRCILFKETGR